MTNSKPTLILVDGTAYVYRAFHAFRLTTGDGRPTGAVYGVANMLNRIVRDYSPEYLVVVFDAKGKTFRDDMYAEYKANRSPMPDDLRLQYQTVQELVAAMGIKSLSITGVEADDVIATLAIEADKAGLHTIIASNDKDLAQLVTDDIVMLDEQKNLIVGPSGVKKKYGVNPNQIVDFLSLVGDSSDNIPGVPLVGMKTAANWLAKFESLDNIVANADIIKGKAGENLRNSLTQLDLARQLITLKVDVDVETDFGNFSGSERDVDRLREIYSDLEFNTWLAALDDTEPEPDQGPEYHAITHTATLESLVRRLSESKLFAFDTETTGFDINEASLVGISVSLESNEAFYIPVGHSYTAAPTQLDRDVVLETIKPVFENSHIAKVAQNIKFDIAVLGKYGVEVKGELYDTMIESYVLNSTAVLRHGLDSLALKYLNHATIKYEDVAGKKGKNQLTFDQVELDKATEYAAEDADIALRLHEYIWPKLSSDSRLQNVFTAIDMPLMPVLMRMEKHGVKIDREALAKQGAELFSKMQSIEKEIFAMAGTQFNISSPKQIGEVLFGILQLPSSSKTSTGQPSTSEAVLSELAIEFDVPRLILEHRSLAKLKSTYTDKLQDTIDAYTQRVHTSYHQAVAATGRLSSTDPNLQNIPIRTAEGRRIREAFIAEEGHVLVSIDYSQIELRIMAHLSEDPGLLEAFAKGEDVHRFTAAEVFDVARDEVTSDQRRHAKAINFGLMYGMSSFGLSRQLQIEVAQATEYVDQYFLRYPKVREFMDSMREKARSDHYVETIYGRRLYVPDINTRHYGRRQHAERTAINAPLQGTAADIIKLAMIEVDRWLEQNASSSRMIMQVHDELVLEIPESEQQFVCENVKSIMENATKLHVPLIADAGVGLNWAQAHE